MRATQIFTAISLIILSQDVKAMETHTNDTATSDCTKKLETCKQHSLKDKNSSDEYEIALNACNDAKVACKDVVNVDKDYLSSANAHHLNIKNEYKDFQAKN